MKVLQSLKTKQSLAMCPQRNQTIDSYVFSEQSKSLIGGRDQGQGLVGDSKTFFGVGIGENECQLHQSPADQRPVRGGFEKPNCFVKKLAGSRRKSQIGLQRGAHTQQLALNGGIS